MRIRLKKLLLLPLFALLMLVSCSSGQSGTFEVGDGVFLLNGKPIVLKAAELHYPRIPEAYWEHRILSCKALGMNAICMYVFWNIHEPEKGKFDFSGNNDISKFCRLAQKHGMYVIVRPGPYVCAEWEMGGLPWWLLKRRDIQLRTQDPYFMERVSIFMKEVGNQLADQLITKGGNIIMVQVENEYGSYATDKPYVSAIRDIVKQSGFEGIPLFQCDWSSNFTNNALDDLLWTVNFGTGANIEAQFKKLKSLRPDTPLMCSEFWSGWFDHWGCQHETRSADDMVSGIKDMLDRNISFSLYMTHGGTTFGWWGGANNPAYSAMCSSYDYDAPISEAGWTTPKYLKLRELLKQYQPEGTLLPEPPEALPVIEVSDITEWEVAPLFENLPEPKICESVQPMEDFDQGWGSILYRTILTEEISGAIHIDEVHDWAQVFADGKLLGRLDRRRGEFTLPLRTSLPKGTRLDILVEAMGRVNFDKSIHDHKGISRKVEVMNGANIREIKKWQVYNLPPFYKFVADKNYQAGTQVDGPAYYKATFRIDTVGDTFLDMQTWGKGMVWVNGHAMGRFWEIGPQQTLYMPGCWLNEGENEIIILDLKGPSRTIVKGLKQPILDLLREKGMTHRNEGESLQLYGERSIATGTFIQEGGWQQVYFDQPATGRYFCLQAKSNYTSDNVVSIAEFDILGSDGKAIPRLDWEVVYADSEETWGGNFTADKMYDLQESTYWKTTRASTCSHAVVFDLGREYTITGFRMLPRAEKGIPGLIKNYAAFVSKSGFIIR